MADGGFGRGHRIDVRYGSGGRRAQVDVEVEVDRKVQCGNDSSGNQERTRSCGVVVGRPDSAKEALPSLALCQRSL